MASSTRRALVTALCSLVFGCGVVQDFGAPAPVGRTGDVAPPAEDPGNAVLPPSTPTKPDGVWRWLNPTPPPENILAIGAAADDNVWFVGERGAVYHWNGKVAEERFRGDEDMTYYTAWASGSEVWIAGRAPGATSFATRRTEVLHFDGATWSTAYSIGDTDVYAFWGAGPNDVWAATGFGLYRWNGANWSRSLLLWGTEPGLGPTIFRDLWGSGPNDVWAVGEDGTRAHFDGVDWTVSREPSPWNDYDAVWGSGPRDVWAMAYTKTQRGGKLEKERRFLTFAHYDGVTWTHTPADRVGCLESYDRRPELIGKRIWGAGGALVAKPGCGLFRQWTPEGWTSSNGNLPGFGRKTAFGGVSSLLLTSVVSGSSGQNFDVARFDGSKPQVGKPIPLFPGMRSNLDRVVATTDGQVLSDGLVWTSGGWARHAPTIWWSSTPGGSAASSATSTKNAWFIDPSVANDPYGGALVAQYDGTRVVHHQFQESVTSVTTFGSDDTWVGSFHGIHHFDGAGWTTIHTDPSGELALVGGKRGDVWAVLHTRSARADEPGYVRNRNDPTVDWKVLHFEGGKFRELYRAKGHGLANVIWSRGPSDVWIGGRPGIHFDGSTWKPLPFATDASITSITGLSSGQTWFVDDQHRLFSFDGVSVRRETRAQVTAVSAAEGQGVWAVGLGGTTLHLEASRILPVRTPPVR